jgi:D-alanyl-D-alanine carboxypeptidase
MGNLVNEKRPVIKIETLELGPHAQKKIFLPKESGFDKHKTLAVWFFAAIAFGVALTSFLVETGEHTAKAVDNFFASKEVALTENKENLILGSDDQKEDEEVSFYTGAGNFVKATSKNPPKTSSLSYLVGDIETGEIIFEKNPEFVFPIASVSKLMTAIVAKELLDLHNYVVVSKSSVNTYGTQGGLNSGERILITDLLYPLLIESSNDAAEVLADGLGRENFLKAMNNKAVQIGMASTTYNDPSGLSPKNVSSTKDLFVLAQFINKNYPDIWDITRVTEYGVLKHKWVNSNRLMRKPSFIGGKNGYTEEAFRTTVSVFDIPFKVFGTKDIVKRKVAVVILKSNEREADVDILLRFLESNFAFSYEKDSIEELGGTN